MKILFITRKYPPSVGGMETVSAGFYQALQPQVVLLALRKRSQLHLIWWLPWIALRALWLSRRVQVIHLGDGVLAGLGVWLRWWTGKPVTVTIHGLDITYDKYGYQSYIHWALAKLDAVSAVSPATALHLHNEFQLTAHVIPNAIDVEQFPINQELGKNRCLLYVGRMVKRKGCAWFIEQVLPHLPDAHLHVVGTGKELEQCQQLVQSLQLSDRVRFHGEVSALDLHKHYCSAQALVMPNIIIPGDMEGFGMVALEAGACGLPVVAANIEGIRAVVVDGSTGFLVDSGHVAAWISAVQRVLTTPFQANLVRQHVANRFSWSQVAGQYQQMFNQLLKH